MVTRKKRNQSLDVLRCVAILLVLGRHFPHYAWWGKVGWIGVDLFFVLSGFLVSGLLFSDYRQNGRLDIGRFILRRGFKIWPAFYAFLAAMAGLALINAGGHFRSFPCPGFGTAGLFLRNYFPSDPPTDYLFGHIWSLAVEEHFYILLPLLLLSLIYLRRRSREPFAVMPILFVVVAVFCFLARCFTHEAGPYAYATHTRMDSLFAGVTLAYAFYFRPHWFSKLTTSYAPAICVLSCLPALLLEQASRITQTIGLTGLYIGFSFLVAWAVVRTPERPFSRLLAAGAARVGFYSYSIYLWHYVPAFVATRLNTPAGATFWLYILGTILFGVLMSRAVEIPALRLRDRWLAPASSVSPPILASLPAGPEFAQVR